MFWSAGCSLLRTEGIFCSLGILYGGLGISKLNFWSRKYKKISSCKFFSIVGHQTLDPDPESGSAIRKNAGSGFVSGSALNQCGSETLVFRMTRENYQLMYFIIKKEIQIRKSNPKNYKSTLLRSSMRSFPTILEHLFYFYLQFKPWLFTTVKSPNFVTAHNFVTAADNFCEALLGFLLKLWSFCKNIIVIK